MIAAANFMHKRRSSQRDGKCRNPRCPGGGVPYRRGLCAVCYRNKAIRARYTPLIGTRCGEGAKRQEFYGDAKPNDFICDQEAGTLGKVELLAMRADDLQELFPESEKSENGPVPAGAWQWKAMQLPFTRRLRFLMARRGYSDRRAPHQCTAKTIKDLALKTNLTATEIRDYLANRAEPTYRAARSLASVLRVSIELLMDPPAKPSLRSNGFSFNGGHHRGHADA